MTSQAAQCVDLYMYIVHCTVAHVRKRVLIFIPYDASLRKNERILEMNSSHLPTSPFVFKKQYINRKNIGVWRII